MVFITRLLSRLSSLLVRVELAQDSGLSRQARPASIANHFSRYNNSQSRLGSSTTMDSYIDASAIPSRLHLPDGHMPRRSSSVPARRPQPIESQVGYVYDSRMLMHSCISGHPEQPARIQGVHDVLKREQLLVKMKKLPIREADRDEILLVHSEHLWDKVMAINCQ